MALYAVAAPVLFAMLAARQTGATVEWNWIRGAAVLDLAVLTALCLLFWRIATGPGGDATDVP